MRLRVIDIETSGGSPSEIIEIAAVDVVSHLDGWKAEPPRAQCFKPLGEDAGAPFASWPADDMFCGWGAEDLAQWPSLFFEFWIPRNRLSVYARDMRFKELKTGSVFTTTKQRGWRSKLGVRMPSLEEIGIKDAALARQIVEERGSVVFPSGYALREELEGMAN